MSQANEIMNEATRRRIDAEMLRSLSESFALCGQGIDLIVSFNDKDISEMLKRAAVIVDPRPHLVE